MSGLNDLLGLEPLRLVPAAALLAAFAFAMTGLCVHTGFWACAAVFFGVTALMAIAPDFQFLIYGGAWFVTLETMALLFRPRKAPKGTAL